MASTLGIAALMAQMKTIFDADSDLIALGTLTEIEPAETELEVPYIGIFRKDVPFEITTVSQRSFRVTPTFQIACSVITFDAASPNKVYEVLENLVDKVIRVIVDNQTWGAKVVSSQPTSIDTVIGRSEGESIPSYKGVAVITLQAVISYT